jgi:hypothetical protein
MQSLPPPPGHFNNNNDNNDNNDDVVHNSDDDDDIVQVKDSDCDDLPVGQLSSWCGDADSLVCACTMSAVTHTF